MSDLPEAICPRCGHLLACDECGWCSHPDRYGGVCGICGDVEAA